MNSKNVRQTRKAPVVNAELAKLLCDERNPMELLATDQGRAEHVSVWKIGTAHQFTGNGRPVFLACGHFTMSKSLKKAACPRCGEMIRAGYDYDGFRNLGGVDEFEWPDDPFRALHEPGLS